MGTCFLYGNGGDGNERNIFVKAYASKNALLKDTPKPNTIGIVTSVNIYATAIQPSAPGNTEGNVWVKDNATAWTKPVIQTIASKSSPKIYVPVFPSDCRQYVSGSWVKKTAYVYQSGEWTQFSKEFTATIKVTYPSGSTCTATNGSTKFTAPNTSGTWTCVVPNTGEWTIKSAKGSQSASKTVSITTDGQSASVTLTYKYYIVNAGGTANYTGGWTRAGNASGGVTSDGTVYLETSNNASGSTTMTTGISNFANYSTLKIVQSTSVNGHYFSIVDSDGKSIAEKSTHTTTSPITIDLTALNLSSSSLYRFRIKGGLVGGTSGAVTRVTQVWLE